IVPTFTCGFTRENFSLAIADLRAFYFRTNAMRGFYHRKLTKTPPGWRCLSRIWCPPLESNQRRQGRRHAIRRI
ncbi:MAG: hypothetical protein OSA97_19280, partial [Nevskia sp.]|nr:hypothetical protein [Nevskia sp.]